MWKIILDEWIIRSISLQVQMAKQLDFSFQIEEGAVYLVLLVCNIFIVVAFLLCYANQN